MNRERRRWEPRGISSSLRGALAQQLTATRRAVLKFPVTNRWLYGPSLGMKVLVKLHQYSGGGDDVLIESKSVTVDADPSSHVRTVVYNAIHKANWNEGGLRMRSIKYRDKDFDEELDANESDRVVNLATYDVVLVREPARGGVFADASPQHIDGFYAPYGR